MSSISMHIDDMRQAVIELLTEHPQDFNGEEIGVLYAVVSGRVGGAVWDTILSDTGLSVDDDENITLSDLEIDQCMDDDQLTAGED